VPKSGFLLYIIVISTLFGGAPSLPISADNAFEIVDSQTFLQSNMAPAGPNASTYYPAVEKLLSRMTSREKIGQMTQLEIGMITDGSDQAIQVNPTKLHKAVCEYGAGSILNVSSEGLSSEKWHEILRAIQTEATKSRLQVPVLYGIDTIHGPNYVPTLHLSWAWPRFGAMREQTFPVPFMLPPR
jgi:hypothetical protein